MSVRWVQLDEDPELEAILVTEAKAENTCAAYIFDKRGAWNLVGSFFGSNWQADGQDLIRIEEVNWMTLLGCYWSIATLAVVVPRSLPLRHFNCERANSGQ